MKLRILIVDDHDVVRAGMCAILERINGTCIVGEAADGRSAVAHAASTRPDVVLMDLLLPELNGIDAGRQILGLGGATKLVAVSARTDRQLVLDAIQVGFSGYLTKYSVCGELEGALSAVADGGTYLSQSLKDLVVSDFFRSVSSNQPVGMNPLSLREREVLKLVAEGFSSRQISSALHVASKTVEAHRLQIMKKLHIRSVAGLTKYAVRHGITQP